MIIITVCNRRNTAASLFRHHIKGFGSLQYILFLISYSVRWTTDMYTCVCVCVCVPFPPFSFPSAFSQELPEKLFTDATLSYITCHPGSASDVLWEGGAGYVEGSIWSWRTRPFRIHSVCDSYCPQRHQPHVPDLHTNTFSAWREKHRKPISYKMNVPRNVLILMDRQEIELHLLVVIEM